MNLQTANFKPIDFSSIFQSALQSNCTSLSCRVVSFVVAAFLLISSTSPFPTTHKQTAVHSNYEMEEVQRKHFNIINLVVDSSATDRPSVRHYSLNGIDDQCTAKVMTWNIHISRTIQSLTHQPPTQLLSSMSEVERFRHEFY